MHRGAETPSYDWQSAYNDQSHPPGTLFPYATPDGADAYNKLIERNGYDVGKSALILNAFFDPDKMMTDQGQISTAVAQAYLLSHGFNSWQIDGSWNESAQDPGNAEAALKAAFGRAGVTRDNWQASSLFFRDPTIGSNQTVVNALLYQMGPGFANLYNSNTDVQGLVNDRVAQTNPGEFVNVSDFFFASARATDHRAIEDSTLAAYARDDDPSLLKIPFATNHVGMMAFNRAVANDALAPPLLREGASFEFWTAVVNDAMLFTGGAKAIVKNIPALMRGIIGLVDVATTPRLGLRGQMGAIDLTRPASVNPTTVADEAAGVASRLTPRVNVADDFTVQRLKWGLRYSYLDPTEGHGLEMSIDKNGVLGFEIRAQGDAATLGSGRDMFLSGMQRLRSDGVNVTAIRGYWVEGTDSVNFQQYQTNLNTMTPQQAAANTWTGRMANDLGYIHVSEPTTSFGNVSVLFTR